MILEVRARGKQDKATRDGDIRGAAGDRSNVRVVTTGATFRGIGSLFRLSGLHKERFLLEDGRVAVHQVGERTKVVLVEERNGDLGLSVGVSKRQNMAQCTQNTYCSLDTERLHDTPPTKEISIVSKQQDDVE